MSVFPVEILTPEKRVYDGAVVSITVAGVDGRLTVLAGHAPMLALLAEGAITIKTRQETREGAIGRGMLTVDHEGTAILVRTFRWADENDEETPEEDDSTEDGLL